jgi:predicted 3-demethylubiquinone-9 3-methyltransferase (glyoxalase superfamily)
MRSGRPRLEFVIDTIEELSPAKTESPPWMSDRFGVTWQIVPRAIGVWITDGDAEAAARVMKAVLSMDKLDIVELQNAFGANEERTK